MDQTRRDFLKTAVVLGAAVSMIDRLDAAESTAPSSTSLIIKISSR